MAYRRDLKQEIVDKILDVVSQSDKSGLYDFGGVPVNFKGIVSTVPDKNRCIERREKIS